MQNWVRFYLDLQAHKGSRFTLVMDKREKQNLNDC